MYLGGLPLGKKKSFAISGLQAANTWAQITLRSSKRSLSNPVCEDLEAVVEIFEQRLTIGEGSVSWLPTT